VREVMEMNRIGLILGAKRYETMGLERFMRMEWNQLDFKKRQLENFISCADKKKTTRRHRRNDELSGSF